MKTHWKKMHNPDYLGAYSVLDLPNQELNVTIDKVEKTKIKTDRGDEEVIVAYMKGQKPMILNSTNCKMIEKVLKAPFIEDWKGQSITIYAKKIRAFGEQIDALRIRNKKPSKPVLNASHPKWASALKAISEGNVTIEQIKNTYDISAEDEQAIQDTCIAGSEDTREDGDTKNR